MFPSYTTRHLKGLLRNVDLEQTEWKVIEAIKELKKKNPYQNVDTHWWKLRLIVEF